MTRIETRPLRLHDFEPQADDFCAHAKNKDFPPCGDCDIAATARKLNKIREKGEKKERDMAEAQVRMRRYHMENYEAEHE